MVSFLINSTAGWSNGLMPNIFPTIIVSNIKYANNRFPLSEISAEKQIATYIYNPNNNSEKLIVRGELVPMRECSNK